MIRADEEPVDPKKLLEDASKAKCARAWRAYEVTKYERPAFKNLQIIIFKAMNLELITICVLKFFLVPFIAPIILSAFAKSWASV